MQYTITDLRNIWQHIHGGGKTGSPADAQGERIDMPNAANGAAQWFVVSDGKLWACSRPSPDYPTTAAWVPCPPAEKIAQLCQAVR